jgi:hypothetical protein
MKIEFITARPTLLRPPPDCCQECAAQHEPELPHNLQSLFYGMKFKLEHGRDPTWDDAAAHCAPDVKAAWMKALADVLTRRSLKGTP